MDDSSFKAGAASGFTVRLLTQPLDVLKIRFQLQIEPISNSFKESYYKSVYHASRRIYSEEGIWGLWKGHVPAQYLSIVFGAIQFQTFDGLYRYTKKPKNSINDFLFGGIAGSSASVFCHPIDVLRTRLCSQGQHQKYKGSIDAIRCIAVEEGIYGFFRGLVPSLILIFPQTAIQFYTYNRIKRYLSSKAKELEMSTDVSGAYSLFATISQGHINSLFSGSIAGVVAKTSIYPLEIAKRRLQVQGFEEARCYFGKFHKSFRMLHSLRKTVVEEGIFGLYKGLVPSTIKAAVVSSLTFYFFEQFKKIF